MNRFYLQRNEDEAGISGTGRIAEGVNFSDGTACLRWLTEHTSFGFYRSMDELVAIHGHEGKTLVVWIGDEPSHRGSTDAYQDRCEGVPFATVGGDPKTMRVPTYIAAPDRPAYLGGYVRQCREMFGPGWDKGT